MFSRALCEKKCSITSDPAWEPRVRGDPEEVTRWVIPCVSNIQTNYSWSFRMFRLIARFSKYDFWNPGEILNWYRWNIFFENIFSRPKKNRDKNLKKKKSIFFSWKFVGLEKIFVGKYFYLYELKISPGFQKSYLENRAMSLKMRTRRASFFLPKWNKTLLT